MSPLLTKLARGVVIFVLVCFALLGAGLSFLHSPFFRYPADGEYPPPHINELIWPTLGYPAMVIPGGELTVELDLWTGEESRQEDVSGWHSYLAPSRSDLDGLVYELELEDARTGTSERWPYRSREGRSEEVWHLSFRLPEEVTPELYDLRVECDSEGGRISDGQPHAVAVTPQEDGDFTFVTLSDIHVHERDNSTLFATQTDKGISIDGDPLFLAEAIRQVNLIRPDFVLMLGDYIRGQRRPGELLSEYERFYEAMLQLEVPAFLLPGNHDGYVNEIDGLRWFENNIGPLYYSFDVGGCHFTCLNTYEWPEDDRLVMNKLFYMEPRKWQGQVLGAEDEEDPSTYYGQLAWLEEDLAANRGAPLEVVALHHDPYTPDGRGYSYANVVYGLVYVSAGGGQGKLALLDTVSRHGVDAVFGGHRHTDEIAWVPWEGGGGETMYSCQTCVYFDQGGESDHYPGYRLVEVEEGEITSYAYLDGVSSYPFYDGSVPGGITDLDEIDIPSLDVQILQTSMESEPHIVLEIENYLAVAMELEGIVVEAPAPPPGGYTVTGGELFRSVEIPARPGRVLLYLKTKVRAGTPGVGWEDPGEPAVKTITVEPARG
ncbi:MAG: metallophosphoesterase [Actinobacteria bacterium]|nr:metallophosphoesterase [Actinomycetota bacterium]